jgi:ethanolamine utilization protein EutN
MRKWTPTSGIIPASEGEPAGKKATMQLAEVVGTVVATEKVEGLEGVRFLIVQPLDRDKNPVGRPVVAGDGVAMAAPGDTVYIVGSREAALAMPEPFVPVDHAIVGIVDAVERAP